MGVEKRRIVLRESCIVKLQVEFGLHYYLPCLLNVPPWLMTTVYKTLMLSS